MNYLLKSSRRKSKLPRYILWFVVILILLINIFQIGFVRNTLSFITTPILEMTKSIQKPFAGTTAYFKSKKDLELKVGELEEQIEGLNIALKQKNFIQKENEILREILGHTSDVRDFVTASVLVRPPASPYDTFVIDGGRSDGITTGDSVYSSGVHIGTIAEVSGSSAIVRLLSSSGETIDVLVADSILAEAKGVGGGRFQITLAKDLPVAKGDPVYTDDQYAPIFGTVEAIEKDETSTFQTVHFNLPLDLRSIQRVQIFTPLTSSRIVEEEIE